MKKWSIGAALFILNAIICWPLFRIEYLDDFQSNEGSWITYAKFLRDYWPHVSWYPWSDAGMPFENTYLPGVSAITALTSWIGHTSSAHAFHFIAALAYSLAPVSLFFFAVGVSGRLVPSALAAVIWSLFSPSLVFPDLLHEMGTPWGIRRLRDIVFFGDTPHNVAICLLPISLLLVCRYLDHPTARRFALAVFGTAAVMLTNAFGIVVVFVSSLIIFATHKLSWRSLASVCGIQFAAYLLICRVLPPSLIRLLETNSQLVGGDFRFTPRTIGLSLCFLAILIMLWSLTRRLSNPILQFAILFSASFGGIAFLGFKGINLLPQPVRYHLEMELGFCLCIAFLLEPLVRGKFAVAIVATPLLWVATKDGQFARNLIHPTDITHSVPFREARWIAANLPGQRVLIASEGQFLFNLFADNPQMSAGHEPSAPNWIQQVAVYTIYSGQNAGADDAATSILWLKAFGCGAIVVPGRDSKDHYHAVANPDKFDGMLPLIWRESGESIYKIPQSSPSLAHVVPRSAIVRDRPSNGLDVTELSHYVEALNSPAKIVWENPDRAKITAEISDSEVLSLQITYDPGWEARIGGRKAKVTADGLGFLLIEPECSDCSIELEFTGGRERHVALAASLITFAIVLAVFFWPNREIRTAA